MALNQRLALSGLLAIAASILLITEQTGSDSAVALNAESVKHLPDEIELNFDLEDVGQHWLPAELRGLKSSKSKKKTKTKSKSSSSKSKSSSKWDGKTAAFVALYSTVRLSSNIYGYETGFDEDRCDEFWELYPEPTEE